MIALHRNRMFEWLPSTVVAISACPGGPFAAVGYETGDLELWDLTHMACLQVIHETFITYIQKLLLMFSLTYRASRCLRLLSGKP